jgi:integrase
MYRDAAGAKRNATPRKTYTHKGEARRIAGEVEAKARRHQHRDVSGGRDRWGDWCEEWWPTRTVEDSTLRTEASRRDNHLMPRWGQVPVGAIDRQEIKAWRATMRRAGQSNSNINRIVALLRVSLTAAVDAGKIDHNPALGLRNLPEPPPSDRFLTEDEYNAILEQMPTLRDKLILTMLASTGLRWGEMAGLHWNRVDLDAGLLAVQETFSEKSGLMKAYPKGRRRRTVPLPEWLVPMLRDLEPRGTDCGVGHVVGQCRSPLVLTTPRGAVLRNSNWSPVFRQAVADAGIEPVTIKEMRAAAASWWLDGGSELAEVRDLLGHLDPKTTDRYARRNKARDSAAAAAIPRPKF